MLKITHLDHIAMAAPSAPEQLKLLEKLLGFKPLYEFEGLRTAGFGGGTSQVKGTDIEFEVIDPNNPESFVHRFLAESGPGLHHIAIEVEDIDETVAELERQGLHAFGGVIGDGQWRSTFIHPKETGGILWQPFVWSREPRKFDRTAGGGIVGLKRVDHVSMAVPDRDRQVEFQQRVFGFELEGEGWHNEYEGYFGANMTIPNSQLRFEIIAPSRPDSFVQKFIDKRRPGMHHICCEVESVEAAAAALREHGIEPFGGIIDAGWKKHTFIHPKDSGGVLFQLFEER
ncbi:MAG: VOC family protein [Dehalococcoidia bacterium]|nr:VOC family protein [Dehalococcoidia bacterium]